MEKNIHCNAEFGMKNPEIEIENYEIEKLHEVDSGDSADGNEACE